MTLAEDGTLKGSVVLEFNGAEALSTAWTRSIAMKPAAGRTSKKKSSSGCPQARW